ncbi:MAG: tetraacyldisaccharide 4'-kinase [Bacteroidetes bacterium GWC2_33_15]|nr:MAG: tetraacyldisaccharide 4'-kinase [Bacteroidetes bacterium GWA2_33_15]OFX52612.1 MAG: tetraacyldisaccharide 4'-kinase [Bacteroidetes bacterium GWC2_33_15]OFX63957.1 MAG: tetraacyldisaccharide 4'-kinase [Bacteroidetes bacterium GWB2_32_14]OFX70776.1 MAG: tetraacyldisaccharide 4'-kinase [Bacteroidetes bacterium GWD2_33_33]HAN19904.1 tetraacyldisaccharide 4'-kinase [Bacteroidales bacterium]
MHKLRIYLSPVLFPVSLIYALVVYIRNRLYDYHVIKSTEFKIPLISVGNITVGGTGKTPHIEYLIEVLQKDFKIATLSRGYKRTSKGFILATSRSTANDIGDEPRQIKQKFPDVIVAVDSNRVNGINKLLEIYPDIDVVLLDDAYQHRKVKATLSILLIDYSNPICKDHILPFGNLREQSSEMCRANMIIITKSPAGLKPIDRRILLNDLKPYPYQDVFFTTFDYGDLNPVFSTEKKNISLRDVRNYSIVLVTGIANPKPLFNYLYENVSKNIDLLQYEDHYPFSANDIKTIEKKFLELNSINKVIITTEKDAMRLQIFSNIANNLKENWFYLPVKVVFQNDHKEHFNHQINEYVRKNKTHGFLYPKQSKIYS